MLFGGEKLADRNWFTYVDMGAKEIEHLALNTDEWKLI